MSPLHYFALIFLFTINAAAATIASIGNQQALTVTYPVDFELPLDVSKLSATSYRKFIINLRTNLAKGGSVSGNVPILPYYPKGDIHLFDVVLINDKSRITIRGRRDNLYLRGYLMETNTWMELREDKDDKLQMIDKSTFLNFFGTYLDLQREAGEGNYITDITYSRAALQKAVVALARPINEKDIDARKERAKSLIVLIQMLLEATRFVQISDHFASKIESGVKVPEWMVDQLERNWGQLSMAVQCYDAYANYRYKVKINGVEYTTVGQLRSILGIMLKEKDILNPKTCPILEPQDEDEGEAAVVQTAAI